MQPRSFSRFPAALVTVTALLALAGCGSGSGKDKVPGTPQPTTTGIFVDSGLAGAEWQSTGGQGGITNDLGEFEYRPFELVTFNVGAIVLGTAEGADFLTPVEMTGSSVPTDQPALNQLVFLQSIDEDEDPSNGISISEETRRLAEDQKLNFFDPNFDKKVGRVVEAITNPPNEVVSESAALLHFYQSYNEVGCTDSLNFEFPGFPECGDGITYKVQFSDEFDSGSGPSPENWNIETGYGPEDDGWGNNEWQLYTDSSDNVRVEDGNLVIQAQCPVEPCGVRDGTITSARINTQDKFEFKYGTIQARIKPPVGEGAWPAFWSLGAVFPETPWPRAGEIDFMEMHNAFSDDKTTHFTMHWCDETLQAPEECTFPEGWVFDTQTRSFAESLGDDYHIFEADWDENRVVGKIDGITYFTRTIDPEKMEEFLREFFMILNVAMGGTLGSDNQPPTGNEVFPQTMLVDWVRVYERMGGEEPTEDTLIDFEGPPESYDFGPGGGFGGGASAVVNNPVAEDINTSAQTARMLKFDAEPFGGSTLTLDSPVSLPGGRPITMKVWSPRAVDVLVKIEGPVEDEKTVTHGGTGWEELTFDFSDFSGSVVGLTFIFDLGTNGDAANDPDNWTFYYDDILLPSAGGDSGSGGLVTDFEGPPESYDFGPDGGFGGGAAQVIANPVVDGNNTSDQVARMQKFAAEPFGGATLALDSTLTVPSGSSFTMKVWSPRAVDVLFKLEGGPDAETTVTHGGSGWETLTFNFSGISGGFTGITFIFDNGTVGDAGNDPDNWTFYFDDIILVTDDDGGPVDPGGPEGLVTDFEGPTTSYDFGPDGGFEGGFAEATSNPFPASINPSARVARLLKFAGAPFAGSTLMFPTPETANPLAVPIDSSFTMKVWSARTVDVLFKPEGGPDAETTVTHGGTGWEELTFDFPGFTGDITGITFIFDNGTVGDAEADPVNWTFYIDDIILVTDDGSVPPPSDDTLEDFEGDPASYTFNDFEGGVGSVIANPNPGGINTSAQTGQMQKFAGAAFAGSTLVLDAAQALAEADSYKMKVFSAREVVVTLKLEPLEQEATATHTGGSTWQELCFDFTGVAGNVTGQTLIFDNGTVGDAENDPDNWTFQFDDIEQQEGGCGTTPPPTGDLGPLDFEPEGLGAAYAWTVFENGDNPPLEFIANPDASGINLSATVAQFTARQAGQPFAGVNTLDLPTFTLDESNAIVKIMVWKSVISDVGLKFETADLASSGEIKVANTVVDQWEELTFDFSGKIGEPSSTDITGFVVFPDFNDARDGDNVVYFDNITFNAVGEPPPSDGTLIDFEGDPESYTFADFEGGVGSVIANPSPGGINDSAQTGQMQKFAGAAFAGSTLVLDTAQALAEADSYKMKVFSPREVVVTLKLEVLNQEATATHTGGGDWQELCFDFTGVAGEVTGHTLIFDNGTVGDAAGDPDNWTFQFDDIEQQEGGCGTTPPPSDGTLIDFEGDPESYTFADFEGGVGSVIANPSPGGINDSAQTGQMQKFAGAAFAGSTLVLDTAQALAEADSYKMKVFSAREVVVTLKLEVLNQEATATHTGGGDWQELCFDFTGVAGEVTGHTLIFDNGTVGDAAGDPDNWTFQFDDIEQQEGGCGTTPPPTGDLGPLDFEPEGLGAAYAWTVFENGDNPPLEFIANPDASGINLSATVAQFTARQAGQSYAGVNTLDLPTFTLDESNAVVKIMVWKSVISDVGLKFETADLASSGEIKVANTVVDQWEELTFDFSGKIGEPSSTDIVGFVIFPDFDTRAQDNVIYFDNITFNAVDDQPPPADDTLEDFEGDPESYTFNDFEGGVGTVIANPNPGGINTSAQVGQMQKFAGAAFAGSTLALDAPQALAEADSYKMKVFSPREVVVTLKLEPLNQEATATHTGSGTWEELCFDFTGVAGEVTGQTLIFDNGTVGDAAGDPDNWTFQFDDIEQQEGGCDTPPPPTGDLGPLDFEPEGLGAAYAWTVFENGDNPPLEFIANPDASDPNTSNTVAQFTARQAGQPFAGVNTLDLPTFTLDESNAIVRIMVWKSVISDVGIKFEQGQASTGEIKVANTLIDQWEELTFDFTGKIGEPSSTDITGFVIFPDFDTRAQDNVIYFDNITFNAVGDQPPPADDTLVDFEGDPESYTFADFEGGVGTVIANPNSGGINTSAQTGQMQKFAGAAFAGSTLVLDAPQALAAADSYKMKVFSSREVVVTLKLEPLNQETTATHTGGGDWQELCFDFTGVAGEVTGHTLIFDNGTVGDAAGDPDNWTFQFDDIQQQAGECPAPPPPPQTDLGPLDFEPDGLGAAYAWMVFENGDNPPLEFIPNPDASGPNTSDTVAQFTARQAGQPFAGTNTMDLPTFTLDESNAIVRIMVWKSVISDVGIKFEQGQASTGEIKVANTLIDQWEELTFDFTGKIGEPSSTDITGFVVFPDFDARSQENVIYFDNITFSASN